ncbi:lysozyme [Alkalimonas sp. NCh-2]|uniref:lysozyme n=1 Tax=Alkalimonas sp. NCh-2 TaxID=3144846 RepID=UPI0031F6F1ED
MANLASKLAALGLGTALIGGGVFIAKHEGEVLGTYSDPVGMTTSCYGRADPSHQLGQVFSPDECVAQLAEDIKKHDRQLTQVVRVQLSEQEYQAYLSFHYNVGPGNFRSSTLLRKLNAGDRVDACIELTHACSKTRGTCEGWTYAGGRQLPGLVTRRREERDLCLQGALSHEAN